MAGRIRQEDVEAVRERADLVGLVQGYLTLKKAGHDSYVGLCPFHTEKTPSFHVSPSKGLYHCFGCGAGGDATRFLMSIEGLTFREAVERLAQATGITLRYEGDTPAERRAASRRHALYRANAEAAALYHRTLLEAREGAEARAYLATRGIDGDAVRRFQVGYAPAYPDFLLRRLSRTFSPEVLVEAGLAVKDPSGAVRDRFRGRVTFPVHDLSGRAVGFGARTLPSREGDGPKYLNSPDTPVYRKGDLMYHLHQAKGALTRSGRAFVVEGYTDVIALVQAGVEEAVATCGTALSEGHFRLLSRFAGRAILAFDSDEAGARAAERAFAFHEDYPVQPVVLILPEGLDPADFVRTRGGEAFLELAEGALPLVRYMIDRAVQRFDLSTEEGRALAVDAAVPVVVGLKDPVRQREYAHYLAERVGVSEEAVLLRLERSMRGPGPGPPGPGPPAPAARRESPRHQVERTVLKLLLQDADIFRELIAGLGEEHFDRAQYRRLFEVLRTRGPDVPALLSEVEDDRLVRLLSALAIEPVEVPRTAAHAVRVRLRLEEFRLKQRSDELRQRLQRLNPLKDPEFDALFQELSVLHGELRRVREEAERVSTG